MKIQSNLQKGIHYINDSLKRKKYFGIKLSLEQIMAKISPFVPLVPPLLQKKLQTNIENEIERQLTAQIDFDSIYTKALNKKRESGNKRKKLWMMWLQGEDNAPELVKKCIQRAREVAEFNNYEFTLITSSNMNEFCDVPKSIIKKNESGKMSNAHFADCYRCLLLSGQGGLWLDATVYIVASDLNPIFNSIFYSVKRLDDFRSVAHRRWSTSCLESKLGEELLLPTLSMALVEYWEKNEIAIDYLLIDYLISILYSKYPKIKDEIDAVPLNNRNYDMFEPLLNQKYNSKYYFELINNTDLFKLSHKVKIKGATDSYYNVVIEKKEFNDIQP